MDETTRDETKESAQGPDPSQAAVEAAAETPSADHEAHREKDSGLWVEFDIQAPADEVTRRIDAHADRYAAQARIPGFRKGKVPPEVVKTRYRRMIIDEVLTEVIESFVTDRIRKDQLQVVSRPELRDIQYEDGGDLKASVRVETLPQVSLPDLETVEVEIPADKLQPSEFKEAEQVEAFLLHHRRREPVKDRPIEAGDVVTVLHQAQNTETRRLSPRRPMQVEISAEDTTEIPDISKELTGRSAGETVVFRRTYPRDFPRKSWAGREMEHKMVIDGIYSLKKPELNADFLKSLGFDSREAFVKRLQEEYEKHQEKTREETITGAIAERLAELADFPVPDTLVRQEIMQAAQQNPALLHVHNESEKAERIAGLEAMASRNIRFSLLLEALKKEFGVTVEAEELEAKFREMAEAAGAPLKEVRKYYAPEERRRQLTDSMERDKALAILREKVTIKEV